LENDLIIKNLIKELFLIKCTEFFKEILLKDLLKSYFEASESLDCDDNELIIPIANLPELAQKPQESSAKTILGTSINLENSTVASSQYMVNLSPIRKSFSANLTTNLALSPPPAVCDADRRKCEKIALAISKKIFDSILANFEFMSDAIKTVFLQIYSNYEKNSWEPFQKEEMLRKLFENIFIEQMLNKALNDPLKFELINGVVIKPKYYKIVNLVHKILRSLFLNKPFLPHDSLNYYANSFILNNQYFLMK